MQNAVLERPPELRQYLADGGLRLNLHYGQVEAWNAKERIVAIISGSQGGKALPITESIPTPDGFRLMQYVRVGDKVFDNKGRICNVTRVTEIMNDHKCYKITFDSGISIIADADHQWKTYTFNNRRGRDLPTVKTTIEILNTLRYGKNRNNHAIKLTKPVEYVERKLTIHPYVLGVWLGDGRSSSSMFYSADLEIVDKVNDLEDCEEVSYSTNSGKALGYCLGFQVGKKGIHNPITKKLKDYNLLNNKHIPTEYLQSSVEQRLELLRGLMDTDGYCGKNGVSHFYNSDKYLIDNVRELLSSLGIKYFFREKETTHKLSYILSFSTYHRVFSLERKAIRQSTLTDQSVSLWHYITNVEEVKSVPVKCIEVDSKSHLYLASKNYIVTHNTSFIPNWLLREIKLKGNGDYLYVTPTFTLLDKKALPEFLEVFERRGKLGRFFPSKMKFVFSEAGMRFIHGINTEGTDDHYDSLKPTTVFFGYAKKPDSLESMTAKAAVLDEAGQEDFKLDSWLAILRRLSIHQGRVLIGTTPYNFGWLYTQIYQRWLQGDTDIRVVNFPSTANPLFPREELERAKRTMPKWKFEMFYLGQFTKPAGLIYDVFDHSTHVIKPFEIPQHWKRFGAIDFGGMNKAATFYAEEPHTGVAYMFDEYFPHHYKPLRDHVVDMMANKVNAHVNSVANQVSYNDKDWLFVAGTVGERQWRIEMSQYGLHAAPSFVREVELGIDKGYSMLKRNKIKIFDTCVMTINEFNTYSRLTNGDGDVIPNTIENKSTYHLLDSYRYFSSYFGNEDINPNWSDDALAMMHPDGELAGLLEMMDDEDVDIDNPMVQRIIRKHNADTNKPQMMKHDRLTDEDRNFDNE